MTMRKKAKFIVCRKNRNKNFKQIATMIVTVIQVFNGIITLEKSRIHTDKIAVETMRKEGERARIHSYNRNSDRMYSNRHSISKFQITKFRL